MSLVEQLRTKAAIALQNAHVDVQKYVAQLEAEVSAHFTITALALVGGLVVGVLAGHYCW